LPRLHFKGKVIVENHHLAVPFHELLPVREKGLSEKAKRERRIPLSRAALPVLAKTREAGRNSRLLFPTPTGKVLRSATVSGLTRGLGIVAHGLRTWFRNWCAETGVRREVAERCLAHVVRNQSERAYSRTDLLEQRREVMEAWAGYIAGGS